jgi:hypothetical protein
MSHALCPATAGPARVVRTGYDGGIPLPLDLFPAFDLTDHDGMTYWCVRQRLMGGDSVPVAEVFNGSAEDILAAHDGEDLDGEALHADGIQHEVCGYLAALFAAAPRMHALLCRIAQGEPLNGPADLAGAVRDLLNTTCRQGSDV